MQTVSEAMIRQAYAEEAEAEAALLTIAAVLPEGPVALRFSDQPGGVVSRGQSFPYRPFVAAIGGASADEAAREAQAELGDADGEAAYLLRQAIGRPTVLLETVRLAAPDVVELSVGGIKVTDSETGQASAGLTLKARSYGEPACRASYVYARTPGLF